ncbi:transposase [Synechococcus sp. W60.3]|uniref:transposase n=1 Tax=Synechococcus sp. W60.3 TaxID=2967125 RepID=UPI0039C67668
MAEELQEVFVARRRGTAESLAQEFVERYRDRFKRAVEVFAQGLGEALTYLDFPGVHQRHIKSTNVLERLIREVKRRSFPGEGSLVNLATVVMLRATEDWAFRRYGHGPALGRGRETHKNRDLTCGGLLRQPLTRSSGQAAPFKGRCYSALRLWLEAPLRLFPDSKSLGPSGSPPCSQSP